MTEFRGASRARPALGRGRPAGRSAGPSPQEGPVLPRPRRRRHNRYRHLPCVSGQTCSAPPQPAQLPLLWYSRATRQPGQKENQTPFRPLLSLKTQHRSRRPPSPAPRGGPARPAQQTVTHSRQLPPCPSAWPSPHVESQAPGRGRNSGRGHCARYLSTRSEAWLDLGTSQLWCFSWALASFSAAAMGHPERLQRQKGPLSPPTAERPSGPAATAPHSLRQTRRP